VSAWYNEIDPFAAQWLRNLIADGLIPQGEVDERSIADVSPADLRQFRQCHFFAGIGGWALAARLAGWPDDRELWTGSCPCQPFSVAGDGRGHDDERDLWPEQFRLLRECRPARWMGEQVADAIGKGWLDRLFADLDSIGYAAEAAVLEASHVGAPHKRKRLYVVADRDGEGREGLVPAVRVGLAGQWGWRGEADLRALYANPTGRAHWPEPLVCGLADGLPAGMDRSRALKGFGNAIVPQLAAEVIAAYMEAA
jgi:DNA (cytosine-5)-methyltransferase 1